MHVYLESSDNLNVQNYDARYTNSHRVIAKEGVHVI